MALTSGIGSAVRTPARSWPKLQRETAVGAASVFCFIVGWELASFVAPTYAVPGWGRILAALVEISGFDVTLLDTGPFLDEPKPEFGWVEHLFERYMLSKEYRGDGIYAVGKKVAPVKERYPSWLYT